MRLKPVHNHHFSFSFVVGILILVSISVSAVRAKIFPKDRGVVIGEISFSGNKKTHNYILLREVVFQKNDTIQIQELEGKIYQSRLNLLNTSLFNFVSIDTVHVGFEGATPKINISIHVIERWYLWTSPIMKITDRNLNVWLQTHDYSRFNWGLSTKWLNFTGRRDELDIVAQAGKNRLFSLGYFTPYVDKRKKLGIGMEVGYGQNREVGFMTQKDKLLFAFDPKGLLTERFLIFKSAFRNSYYVTHEFNAGFRSINFSDSLLKLNPDYSFPNDHKPTFTFLYYKLKIDHRDIKYYPLIGWYSDLEIDKLGLGFNFEKPVDVICGKLTTRLFSKLANHWYSGISMIGKLSSNSWQPYFLMQGLGYNRDFVRGYEYQVIDGKHYGLLRTTIKYALMPEQTRYIKYVKTPKFALIHYAMYLTAFTDAAYVWQPQWIGQNENILPRTLLLGFGLGADLVTYYDKVIRLEYSMNKFGKGGFFIHFISGI